MIHEAAAKDTTRFRGNAREARIARLHGDLDHAHPHGIYAARILQGAPMVPCPHPDAVVTAPGATLDEVKDELAAERACTDSTARACAARDARRAERMSVIDEVRSAFTDEARAAIDRPA